MQVRVIENERMRSDAACRHDLREGIDNVQSKPGALRGAIRASSDDPAGDRGPGAAWRPMWFDVLAKALSR